MYAVISNETSDLLWEAARLWDYGTVKAFYCSPRELFRSAPLFTVSHIYVCTPGIIQHKKRIMKYLRNENTAWCNLNKKYWLFVATNIIMTPQRFWWQRYKCWFLMYWTTLWCLFIMYIYVLLIVYCHQSTKIKKQTFILIKRAIDHTKSLLC